MVEDAVRLQSASEKEPGAAAWLKHVSDMRFSRNALKRSAKAFVEESQVLKQIKAQLVEVVTDSMVISASKTSQLRSHTSGMTAWEHIQQAKEISTLALHDLRSALCTIGMVGAQIRCTRTEASNVEPWALIVDYVSPSFADTASAMCALDLACPLTDESGAVAPDVVILFPQSHEQPYRWFTQTALYQSYLGIVFTRTPVCVLPSQCSALPVLVWVKSAEQLLTHKALKESDASEEELEGLWIVHADAMHTVNCAAKEGMWSRLASHLAEESDAAKLLTEANDGPQSVCMALAAVCFSPSASKLWENSEELGLSTPKLHRLCLALLAEAVSRGCRKLCRSRVSETGVGETEVSERMLRDALGVLDNSVVLPPSGCTQRPQQSEEFDLQRALRRSALFFAPGGKYFEMG
eukprot:CAMPEP_0172773352 /NCGR_PEP_ID=MMETSP1074-20121228/194112_1 /TAXON_ID=2916 /ORGANISM="Ceratium fusus, Strain PA161109" /LENGTH=408 /DNA_ID=CAMNT_0013609605 /DNA_START=17 /DNA_END=1240 /DNA_ORIENTATION=+